MNRYRSPLLLQSAQSVPHSQSDHSSQAPSRAKKQSSKQSLMPELAGQVRCICRRRSTQAMADAVCRSRLCEASRCKCKRYGSPRGGGGTRGITVITAPGAAAAGVIPGVRRTPGRLRDRDKARGATVSRHHGVQA